jgi:hypothetical protein
MAAAKPWFPPRRVTDWEEGNVELAIAAMDDFTDYPMRLRSESCVAGKEARLIAGVYEVHVRSTPPSID